MPDVVPVPPLPPPAPTSPTGEAILPPKYVPLAIAVAALPGLIAGYFHTANLYAGAQVWLGLASLVLGIVLGAVSPGLRRTPVAMLAALAALALMVPAPARAADLSMGLSVPLTQVRLAGVDGKPYLTGPRAGYQLTAGFLPMELLGKRWDMLSFGGIAFVDGAPGFVAGSLAGTVCTLQGLACLGFGVDLLDSIDGSVEGALAGKVGRRQLFGLLSLQVNFAMAPSSPPMGVFKGVEGLQGGNTYYISL